MFRRKTDINAVVFGNRNTGTNTETVFSGFILLNTGVVVCFTWIINPTVLIVSQAHTIRREIRVGKRQRSVLGSFTA